MSLGLFVLTQVLSKYNWRAGVPAPVINFTTYTLVVLIFSFAVVGTSFNLFVPLNLFLVFLVAICVYVGNAASIRGFNEAPNPGYSTAINKSYAAVTVVASIFLFGGELAWQKILGVALILGSQLLIVAGETRKKPAKDSRWISFSFIAFFSYAALSLAVKYANANLGINQLAFLFWAILISLFFFVAEICSKKLSLLNYKKQAGSLVLMGMASGFANIFMWNAFVHAPNMGYVNAINVASVAIISLLAVKLFGDELTRRKSLGIAGVILGLILIILY